MKKKNEKIRLVKNKEARVHKSNMRPCVFEDKRRKEKYKEKIEY